MAENLKTTRYNDGSAIPYVTDNAAWAALTTPGYCWYNNNEANKTPYGGYYNWYAVNTGKLCPAGWHVASDPQWTTLITFLGGESVAGGKLKETGTTHWSTAVASNESGFTALPGGFRDHMGQFNFITLYCLLWSSTEYPPDYAWSQFMIYSNNVISRTDGRDKYGLNVRCLKD
jgi:uncharacterized protein (TIGR02145 family)